MKVRIMIGLAAALLLGSDAIAATLQTRWAKDVDQELPWNVYPRPTMKRGEWLNLNGKWDYAITPLHSARPQKFDGKILVPFCVESQLSGVERTVGPDNLLWYTRKFRVPAAWKGDDVLLNFGAVDWKADVWVNGINVGSHTGGYAPWSLNITSALNRNGENTITVKVWDPSDSGFNPSGKQVKKPGGINYTAVTGIWQTVWLEPVAPSHISSLRITPNVDDNLLMVKAVGNENGNIDSYEVTVFDSGKPVASGKAISGQPASVEMPADVKLWSTESPFIYDVEVKALKNGKVVDNVKSYAAMRKIGMSRNPGIDRANGKENFRFTLNDKQIYHLGPLDQGWWPDGLYTAPTYEAMVWDVDKTKDLGFNMIRKHVKVEPELWYEYCDRNGVIVWQDMPSVPGGKWQNHNYFVGEEYEVSDAADKQYRKEWKEIMDALYNHPSINVWIPFNEGWGQHKTVEVANETKQRDPSRLVNPSSGGNFFRCGDVLDVHNYPAPMILLVGYDKANVLGEFGGIGLAVEGHLWWPDRNWGYVQFKTPEEVTAEYQKYMNLLYDQSRFVYTGAVYTQTTDVEGEVNGLITYDREVVKVDEDKVKAANQRIVKEFSDK